MLFRSNLIGGMIVGFVGGEGSFSAIVRTYSTASVGDGLMSQIPALLISVATGMIVTRSASESNLNEDVLQQFASQPTVLMLAGAAIPFLIFIGFPPLQIILISLLLLGTGFLLQRRGKLALAEAELDTQPVSQVTREVDFYRNLDNVYGLLAVDAIGVNVGYSLLPLVDEKSGGNFLDRIVMLRKQFADEMGVVIPSIRLKDSSHLNPNQYEILLRGESVAVGEILVDYYLGLMPEIPPEGKDIEGIETTEPAFGLPAKWIREDDKLTAELMGYTLIDPTSVMITHLSELLRRHADELLSRQEVGRMVENLKGKGDSSVGDIVPAMVTLQDLQKVLRNLLREGVPILDLETILETMSDYNATVKDTDLLTEYVRQALRRTIPRRFSTAGQLKVISLDSAVEDVMIKSLKRHETGTYLAVDAMTMQSIVASASEELDKLKALVQEPIILTSPVVRVYVKKLLDQFFSHVTVLSFHDLEATVQIQSLGTIRLPKP